MNVHDYFLATKSSRQNPPWQCNRVDVQDVRAGRLHLRAHSSQSPHAIARKREHSANGSVCTPKDREVDDMNLTATGFKQGNESASAWQSYNHAPSLPHHRRDAFQHLEVGTVNVG